MYMNSRVKAFQKRIHDFYKAHGRHDLPWRKTRDPYRILVSELMLQQTQVDRVIGKYKAFLNAFPTLTAVAESTTEEMLRVWSGLGYNRRALFLRKACQEIVKKWKSRFPRSREECESLPGIGPYTARAVVVFAFNKPEVVIETNIRRVYLHEFFKNKEKVCDTELVPIIEHTMDRSCPRMWYNALMDYGALALKNIPNPNTRSRQYARQSKFEGSPRYARAKIVKFLLHNGPQSRARIKDFFKQDKHLVPYTKKDHIDRILTSLACEGFIKKNGVHWSIC